MATMNISLPDELKQFIDAQVREHGYGSSSEYLRELVRERQRRQAEDTLRALIAEGLASGAPQPVSKDTLKRLRKQLHERMAR